MKINFWQQQIFRSVPFLTAVALLLQACAPGGAGKSRRLQTPLPVSARILNLPGSEDNTAMVVFFAELRYSDLQFIKTESGYSGEVEVTFSIVEKNTKENVQLIDRRYTAQTTDFDETLDRKKSLRITEKLHIPPGEYMANILVTDHYARTQGGISRPLKVADLRTTFSISKPFFSWDSLASVNFDRMIPLTNREFMQDFFALLVLGGLQAGEPAEVVMEFSDSRGEVLYTVERRLQPQQAIEYVSLRVPSQKLALGVTKFTFRLHQGKKQAESETSLFVNVSNLPKDFNNIASFIEPMRYIMSSDEWQEMENATPERRVELFNEFWRERDPTEDDDENPLMEEFFRRVEEANQRFRWGGEEGWETDRGRIYIIYGAPDNVIEQKSYRSGASYLIWVYLNIGRRFVFEDRYSNGNYQLYSSSGV